ncbi:MAG: hypothetical protein JWO56_1433 [Acidobacteria bacterium]|nr:hypothetical protein [Acidobacteriota bacterium]
MKTILAPLFALTVALTVASPLFARDITKQSVLDGMNAHRAERGLPPLRIDPRIDAAAGDRMHDMEDLGYWSHESPDGRSPFLWLRPHGYPYSFAGENLACGFETSEVLVDAWMESKGHRDNIMSASYTDCGIAIIDGSTTGRAAGKSIVVMFGRQQNGSEQTASR